MKPLILILTLFIYLLSCGQNEPNELKLGLESCVHCQMNIMDLAFAAQMKTNKGKAYFFDSIECMGAFKIENSNLIENARYWVRDFTQPEKGWLDINSAILIRSKYIHSPMSGGLAALDSKAKNNLEIEYEIIKWDSVEGINHH